MITKKGFIQYFRNTVNISGLIGILCFASCFAFQATFHGIYMCKSVFVYFLGLLTFLYGFIFILDLSWKEDWSRDLFKLISSFASTILVSINLFVNHKDIFWAVFVVTIGLVTVLCFITDPDDDDFPQIIKVYQAIGFIAFSLAYSLSKSLLLFLITLVISLSFLWLIIGPWFMSFFGDFVVDYSSRMGSMPDEADNFADIKEKINSHNGYFCYHPRGEVTYIEPLQAIPSSNSLYLIIMRDGSIIYSRDTANVNNDIDDLCNSYGIILDKHIRAILLIKDWAVIDHVKPFGMDIYLGSTYYNAKNDFTVFNYIYMNGKAGNTAILNIYPMSDIIMVYDDEPNGINCTPNNIIAFSNKVQQYCPNYMSYSTRVNILALGIPPKRFRVKTYSNHIIDLTVSSNIVVDVLDQSSNLIRSQTLSRV